MQNLSSHREGFKSQVASSITSPIPFHSEHHTHLISSLDTIGNDASRLVPKTDIVHYAGQRVIRISTSVVAILQSECE